MVLAGHSHTHEFAAGGTTDQVGNPWALDRTAGGSSGGSAAALAARMVPAAVGTDTAGSLRIPAALSGICSIKPTYGRVPDDGCIPLSPTLDHPGPMARSVADASALLAALATEPGRDPTPSSRALPLAARDGPRPLEGCASPSPAAREAADAEADVLDGLRGAPAPPPSGSAPGSSSSRRRRTSTAEDAVTILFHEVWPYHAAHVERRERYRPSIREFVDLAAEVHDPAAYEAAQGRRARDDRALARVVRRARRRPPARGHRAADGLRRAGTATTPATSAARATR